MKKHNHTMTKQSEILFLMAVLLLVTSLACIFAERLTLMHLGTDALIVYLAYLLHG